MNVQAFFKGWGMWAAHETDFGDLNGDVIEHGINRCCYQKMVREARQLYGDKFAHFVSQQVEATDDAFYLAAATWAELEEAWTAFQKGKGPI